MKINQVCINSFRLVVGGFVPITTIDFPGKLSAVIFCQGCPWRCVYCHNTHLQQIKKVGQIAWSKIISFLQKRVGLLDAVVFSGGEPTLQEPLRDAIIAVKELGFEIGLHTAGLYPEKLKRLLPLLSWVGMDLKAPFGESARISRCNGQFDDRNVRKSVDYILQSGVEYEFRTTYFKEFLTSSDIERIKQDLYSIGVCKHSIQEYRAKGQSDMLSLTI